MASEVPDVRSFNLSDEEDNARNEQEDILKRISIALKKREEEDYHVVPDIDNKKGGRRRRRRRSRRAGVWGMSSVGPLDNYVTLASSGGKKTKRRRGRGRKHKKTRTRRK